MIPSVRAFLLIILVVFPIHAAPATAQQASSGGNDASSPDWIPSQDSAGRAQALTREQVDQQIIEHALASPLLSDKIAAIDYAEKLVSSGQLQKQDTDLVALLGRLATEGTQDQTRTGTKTSNDFPSIRARAVALLGKIGGAQAREAALRVLSTDRDTLVLAEAARALGDLIDQPTPAERDAITRTLQYNDHGARDDYLAFEAVSTIEKLYIRDRRPETPGISGGRYVAPDMRDAGLFQALVDVALGPYSSNVRAKALEVIRLIRNDT